MALKYLFIVTAIVEVGAGLALLVWPPLPLWLLLGSQEYLPEAFLFGRVAGAALYAIGVASWLARNDQRNPAQLGLLAGVLIYNVAVAILLVDAGARLSMAGVALWPAVALHGTLATWCIVCLSRR
jgi:hypothetical protein